MLVRIVAAHPHSETIHAIEEAPAPENKKPVNDSG
jgi:hypothetical protein